MATKRVRELIRAMQQNKHAEAKLEGEKWRRIERARKGRQPWPSSGITKPEAKLGVIKVNLPTAAG